MARSRFALRPVGSSISISPANRTQGERHTHGLEAAALFHRFAFQVRGLPEGSGLLEGNKSLVVIGTLAILGSLAKDVVNVKGGAVLCVTMAGVVSEERAGNIDLVLGRSRGYGACAERHFGEMWCRRAGPSWAEWDFGLSAEQSSSAWL